MKFLLEKVNEHRPATPITWDAVLNCLAQHPEETFTNKQLAAALNTDYHDTMRLTSLMRKADVIAWHTDLSAIKVNGKAIRYSHKS